MNARQIVAAYLIAQALGTAAWWALLLLVPESVKWFQPETWPENSLLGFWLSDSVLLIGGSIAVAAAVWTRKAWTGIAIWSLAAAVWYPTLYCLGVSLLTDQAWIASAMMVSMAGLTLSMATIQGNSNQQPATIRVIPMTKTAAVGWTVAQLAIFWGVFLWILPKGIVELESRLGVPSILHAYQSSIAVGLFIVASTLGLWSGVTMAMRGDGTPLPTATAPKLVVAGPYRWVRNPMAVAGIVQGIAVGWMLGSYVVISYAILGIFVWHLFVRPVEEADLQSRFGDSYTRYRHSVGLWIPRIPHACDEQEHHEA
jgi:protein-S-isoprenylcysteine O-methyltransferase Ste14